jgi:hypothetical protein
MQAHGLTVRPAPDKNNKPPWVKLAFDHWLVLFTKNQ